MDSYAGQSRSATCVIAYLMQEKNWTLFQAMGFVKSKRSVIYPNPGFQRQLLDYERKLLGHRRTTQEIAETLPKSQQQNLSDNTPLDYLQKSLGKHSNGTSIVQLKSTETSYKPKYKNLRDAYEEFKALKQGTTSVDR